MPRPTFAGAEVVFLNAPAPRILPWDPFVTAEAFFTVALC